MNICIYVYTSPQSIPGVDAGESVKLRLCAGSLPNPRPPEEGVGG